MLELNRKAEANFHATKAHDVPLELHGFADLARALLSGKELGFVK